MGWLKPSPKIMWVMEGGRLSTGKLNCGLKVMQVRVGGRKSEGPLMCTVKSMRVGGMGGSLPMFASRESKFGGRIKIGNSGSIKGYAPLTVWIVKWVTEGGR